MPFAYDRTIRFHETDAAGVVYFAQVLTLCHEAYEASLMATGIDVREFFGGGAIAVPITHATVDLRRPLFCGDRVTIHLTPQRTQPSTFEIRYELTPATAATPILGTALTRHVCIAAATRDRQPLPTDLEQWVQQWGTAATA